LKKHIVRGRSSKLFVERDGGFHYNVGQAQVFASPQEAETYRIQRMRFPDSCEVCELTEDGQINPVQSSGILDC
jgi:hypothetical protein